MVFPDVFIEQDKPAAMYDVAGMNASHIVETALRALGQAVAVQRA
jgi:1-deoxy-D-xylulose-5-phosphate synthase